VQPERAGQYLGHAGIAFEPPDLEGIRTGDPHPRGEIGDRRLDHRLLSQ
jgi:hypothetical protein